MWVYFSKSSLLVFVNTSCTACRSSDKNDYWTLSSNDKTWKIAGESPEKFSSALFENVKKGAAGFVFEG